MCRNIRPLFNYDPPTTDEDIHLAALQFVRKISGFQKPSQVNEAAFRTAVDSIAAASKLLLDSLKTSAEPRNRQVELLQARTRAAAHFQTRG